MVGGESASVGIVFYDTEKKNENAVFCFYKDSEPFQNLRKRKFALLRKESKSFPNSNELNFENAFWAK